MRKTDYDRVEIKKPKETFFGLIIEKRFALGFLSYAPKNIIGFDVKTLRVLKHARSVSGFTLAICKQPLT